MKKHAQASEVVTQEPPKEAQQAAKAKELRQQELKMWAKEFVEKARADYSESSVMLALSGGMDSTTLAYLAKAAAKKVHLYAFEYGSKHGSREYVAREMLGRHLGTIPQINLLQAMSMFTSDLLHTGGPIPEGHYADDNMKKTVVPQRNLIFISILAGLAESRGMDRVWLGVHSGDHTIYPDCRPDFVEKVNQTVKLSSSGKVEIAAPFLQLDKTRIIAIGRVLGVPYDRTRTCYTSDVIACGKCGACRERLEAFENNGIEDPLKYQTRSAR